jgi:hypothetical protein
MRPFSEAVSTAAGKKEVKEKPEPLALNPHRRCKSGWSSKCAEQNGTRIGHLHEAESDPDTPNLNLWRRNRI